MPLAALAVVGGGLLAFLFLHPMFRITRVHVVGVEHMDRAVLADAIRTHLTRNRFLFDADVFVFRLNEQFVLRDLQIKQRGTFVEIHLVERTSQLIWRVGERAFVVDLDGVVIRPIEGEELEHLKTILPFFIDRNQVEIGVGDTVLTRQETDAVFRFHGHLNAQGISFAQTEFDRLAGKWVGVVTQSGYRILFDPSTNVDEQASRLEVLLKEKISDQNKLEYIDLRFGDHIYFK